LKGEKELKPVSMRVKDAAEGLLTTIMNHVVGSASTFYINNQLFSRDLSLLLVVLSPCAVCWKRTLCSSAVKMEVFPKTEALPSSITCLKAALSLGFMSNPLEITKVIEQLSLLPLKSSKELALLIKFDRHDMIVVGIEVIMHIFF
jgi:hypothetical protein